MTPQAGSFARRGSLIPTRFLRLLRRPDLGRLAVGAKADFSLVDLTHPMMRPVRDPLRSLVYAAGSRAVRDVYVRDGVIVAPPAGEERAGAEFDVAGRIVMAGAIDLHTHIGGGKVNLARALLPEDQRAHRHPRTAHTRACISFASAAFSGLAKNQRVSPTTSSRR